MNIKDLEPGMNRIIIDLEIVEKGPIREFNKFGKAGKVCEAKVRDKTGEYTLVLWNDECDKINQGDKIRIINGYTKRYQGEPQLNIGQYGKYEILKDEE